MDIIEKTKNNILLQQEPRDGEPLATYSFIEERTGGLLTPLYPEDKIYVERIKDAIPVANITNVEILALYMATNTIQQTKTKLIEAEQVAIAIIDLSQYKTYSKFHIAFPSDKTIYSSMNISITGVKDLVHGLESITMSGLDDNGTFLPLQAQGYIILTLDSTDYEFPEKIYHFGGFDTGNGRIFFHIDYMEATTGSPYKYMIQNAIYGDTKLFDTNTAPDSEGNYVISQPYKDNSTYLFKHNGELSSLIGNVLSTTPYMEIDSTGDDAYYEGNLYFYLHLRYSPIQPIIVPTGIIACNGHVYGRTMFKTKITTDGVISHLFTPMLYYASSNITWDYSSIRDDMLDSNNWIEMPTDYGMYRVTVKGTYARGQVSM